MVAPNVPVTSPFREACEGLQVRRRSGFLLLFLRGGGGGRVLPLDRVGRELLHDLVFVPEEEVVPRTPQNQPDEEGLENVKRERRDLPQAGDLAHPPQARGDRVLLLDVAQVGVVAADVGGGDGHIVQGNQAEDGLAAGRLLDAVPVPDGVTNDEASHTVANEGDGLQIVLAKGGEVGVQLRDQPVYRCNSSAKETRRNVSESR
mmetsp:Transcript_2638/g.9027  ORF Transcript_2638/g.9027 Transcript_2638/m.9027 type:complete len:204 (-) Transcript_2638:467-1078(-)